MYIYIQYVLIFTHTCYSRYRRSPDIRHIGISSKIFHTHNMYVSVLVGANVIDVQHEVWLGCLTGKELKPAKQQWMKFRVVQESISQFWISRSWTDLFHLFHYFFLCSWWCSCLFVLYNDRIDIVSLSQSYLFVKEISAKD